MLQVTYGVTLSGKKHSQIRYGLCIPFMRTYVLFAFGFGSLLVIM